MSQLESLLSIAQMQSEQQLVVLQQKRQSVALLNQQLAELVDYSRLYQQRDVGTDGNISTLLVHRQRFISQLNIQIDELTNRISKFSEDVEACAAQWRYFEARRKAIESMHERESSQDNYVKEAIAQQNSDELARFGSASGFNSALQLGLNHA
ncbi:MAG: flagellar FliJ family protein [Granulosicoccaceae bacterium]